MGPVKPWVARAGNDLGRKFGIKTIGGFATSGHITNSDHYKGLALDFMCDIPTGNKLADYAQAHAAEYGITYIIHDHKIWSVARASEGRRAYTGSSPHTDHVHISFESHDSGSGLPKGLDGVGTTSESGGAQGAPAVSTGVSLPNIPGPFDEIANFLMTPGVWLRVAMFIGGVLLLILASGTAIKSELLRSTIRKVKLS